MSDSIFTKIIKGEIPSYKLFENDFAVAFLDIHPSQPGHTIVVPKAQVAQLWDLDEKDYQELLKSAKIVALHLRDVLKTERVGVKVVGVDVPHAHVHLVPFNTPEEYLAPQDMDSEPNYKELEELCSRLKLSV
jgi:histidine triad (HIT) family protein